MMFTPIAAFTVRRAWLQSDAASRTAEVWLDGQQIGERRGGFSRFRLDATASVMAGTSAWIGGMLFTLLIGQSADAWGYGPLFAALAALDLVAAVVLGSCCTVRRERFRGFERDE
ncbi:hypothetical protein [Sphingomonas sp. M1A8_2b]